MDKISIQAFSLELSQKEIMSKIPPGVIEKLKSKGTNAYFQAYSVIHEGISRPRVIGEGYVKIAWPKEAVQTVKGLIKRGLQFFIGHNADNSTKNRRSVGRVVADFQREIKGKLHHIVVGHFPDKAEASKYDVCSIEAEADFAKVDDVSFAQRVHQITGIALGSSNQDDPAFPGAVRLATLQAFGEEEDTKKKKEGDSTMLTFEEVKEAVKKMNIWPAQLFTVENLQQDRVFGKIMQDKEDLEAELVVARKTVEDKDAEIAALNKKTSLIGVQDVYDKLLPEGATDRQKAFYKTKFKPEALEDTSEEGIKKFFEQAETEYQEVTSVLGVTDEGTSKKEGNGGSDDESNSGETEEEKLDRLTEASMV